ncbi:MAG: hypothetical protein ABIH66_14850 [bacterium]
MNLSPETIRLAGLIFGASFSLLMIIAVKPGRKVLLLTATASVFFMLGDLIVESFMHRWGIWICHGEPQLLHVPVVMLLQFFLMGPGLCLTLIAAGRRIHGARHRVFTIIYPLALPTVFWLGEFIWADAGLTTYLRPWTWATVWAAWTGLILILFVTFTATHTLFLGTMPGKEH